MRAAILDEGVLSSITPSALRAYATFEGWTPVESYGQTGAVYIREISNRPVEIVLPTTNQLGDYASIVSQLIGIFAREAGRDELSVFRDVSQADQDVIRVRAPDADEDGAIPLESGVELVALARDMLASAACAAFQPRRTYHLGKVQQAAQYMEKVKLGQTEIGSFVVALIAPVPPELGFVSRQAVLWPELESEPFERRVTRVLAQALDAIRNALSETNKGHGQSAFEEAVKEGVSANLCEAVAAITERGMGSEISLMWARTRPTPQISKSVRFSKNDSLVLKEAARQFRLQEPRNDVNILGVIERCRRETGHKWGTVSIAALVDGRAQMVTIDLPQDQYEMAVRAHEKQNAISIAGDLRREGQRWRLQNPRELSVIPGSDEGPQPNTD